MAKSELRIQARKLRQEGMSVKEIAEKLGILRTSVSRWTRDIIWTIEDLEKLTGTILSGRERTRLKAALSQKTRRYDSINTYMVAGIAEMKELTPRELLVAGLALYWAEGAKKKERVEFCNSDPKMVQFLTLWLQKCFDINSEDLICWVGINEAHAHRNQIVIEYWSNLLKIPLTQFRNTSFKRVQNIKIYENFEEHFGTLYMTVAKSSLLHRKIMGLIAGLSMAG